MRPAFSIIASLFLASLLAACAGPAPGGSAAPKPETAPFVRAVTPFEVRDAMGDPFDFPFLGGLNVPRPQFIDIDADGDNDLFVQEATGEVMFFEQVGTPEAPRLAFRSDRYQNLDVGEWYRFADLDGDGDYDLLAEELFSYIRYYRNDGTPENPRFTLAADSLRDVTGTPIFSDRQNIPNVTDIDCDGLRDLFIGRLDGSVARYEARETEDGLPRFELVAERFEDISIVSQFGSLHGANSLTFADLDGDGDQDLFWGDFFEAGLLFIENTGTCEQPSLRGEPLPFPPSDPLSTSGYNAPAVTDYDGDGDLDLFVGVLGGAFNPNRTAAANFYFLEQTERGFTRRTRRFLDTIDLGTESIPAFADLDADGDLDLFLANKIDPTSFRTSRLYQFENQGSATAPSFQLVDTLDFVEGYHYAPAFGDLDGDGDLDMLLGTWNKGVAVYPNEGTAEAPAFGQEPSEFIKLSRGSNSIPALADLDADGDLDLFVGESSGEVNFYRNEGTPESARFVLETDTYGDFDVGQRSAPAFADLDGDGDFDLALGSEGGELFYYRNAGTPEAPAFVLDEALASIRVAPFAVPTFADIDGDGDTDFFSGGLGGGLLFFENQGR